MWYAYMRHLFLVWVEVLDEGKIGQVNNVDAPTLSPDGEGYQWI